MSHAEESSSTKPDFSVRIVVCDHYLTKPTAGIDVIYSEFRGSDIKQVPVLRIFGPTPDGRKACLHVHGVFPYFYIPCPTSNPEPQFLYQIAASLDKALNIALKQATSANQHVYKITLVKGLPFYGFHDKEHLYLKVFLYSPGLIKQAVELCTNGAILGQVFQPHESHLNFTLQFFIDFNLFGMSNIDLQHVKYRKSGLSQCSDEPIQNTNEFGLKPESSCFFEVDCMASHIVNRQRVGKGDGIENPGLEEVWHQEMERRKQLNMSMGHKSLSQGRLNDETESHYKYEQMFLLKMSGLVDKLVTEKISSKPEEIQYPAESMEGSQLFKAVDVSMHLPDSTLGVSLHETLRRSLDNTLVADVNDTIVDEQLALDCSLSLHYSQVMLNNEDLELVDMLQDMEDKPVEDDSVMGTPANVTEEGDEPDDEYSQIYDENTIIIDPCPRNDNDDDKSPSWNDSFWDGVSIPQLDGTFDDDHVKKVRKRKMRPFKLGLSKPKATKKENVKELNNATASDKMDVDEVDVINASRETIDDISGLHVKRVVKDEPTHDIAKESNTGDFTNESQIEQSITDLVNKVTFNNTKLQPPAEVYDLKKQLKPIAGPSKTEPGVSKTEPCPSETEPGCSKTEPGPSKTEPCNYVFDYTMNDSQSSTENEGGIVSFYNASKLFDVSLEANDNFPKEDNNIDPIKTEMNVDSMVVVDSKNSFILAQKTGEQNVTSTILTPKIKPPTKNYIISNLGKYNILKLRNKEPYYSNHKDVGDKVEIGQMLLKLHSKLSRDQKPFDRVLDTTSIEEWRQLLFLQTNEMSQESAKPEALKTLLAGNKSCVLEPVIRPPNRKEVEKWLEQRKQFDENEKDSVEHKDISKNIEELDNSQALGLHEDEVNSSISLESNDKDDKDKTDLNNSLQVTMQPDGSFLCFGNSEHQTLSALSDTPVVDMNYLTVMVAEVHTSVRGTLHPDPAVDAIQAIFLKVTNDCPPNHLLPKSHTEILVVDENPPPKYLDRCVFSQTITYVNNESEILEKVMEFITKHDPDIMCGYEIEMKSWGYILERSQILGLDMIKDISRITDKYRQKRFRGEENNFEGRVIGRVMFNVWRLFRHELALSSYSFENCMYEVLKERVPKYSYTQLHEWWRHESRLLRWIPVDYYLTRLSGTVRMLEKLDIINRTSELARLFGLQWWEVLSRGSQFRVESLMLRAARPLNLIALSPSVKQRAAMKAPECLPLIFEPESRFYSDPVIVLDFQSLYPSMMIAYNYCFSTCIGRVQNINGDAAYEFGAWRLRIPKAKLEALVKNGLVHWSPVGVGFVKSSVRRGVLPALLRRILAARQAVKKSMKMQTNDAVKKAMHSRQLGLKLIANVTYGYTAANFSGRMPCVEVGDSVVAKGRETLERAVKLVRDGHWNAKVVYGDTDSMFVMVPGGTRAEAFLIGQQIADAVTADNPSPVALKLEKVYQPCILQTKKRYVGFMYESADQHKPVFEAKGIETVRRDGCPAGVKLLHQCLCELFETGDMSRVKRIVMGTLSRLCAGTLPVHELFFSREYHGPTGYRPGATAPPNEIAKRICAVDRRAGPRAGSRVLWLAAAGAPGCSLAGGARPPLEVARDPSLKPHIVYYAARVLLPPLHRCLSLLGVDVFKWWSEVGYTRESQHTAQVRLGGGIARYMWRERCAACGARGTSGGRGATGGGRGTTGGGRGTSGGGSVCAACMEGTGAQRSAATFTTRLAQLDTHVLDCQQICASCCGHAHSASCENMECPALWRRLTAQQKLSQTQEILANFPVPCKYDLEF